MTNPHPTVLIVEDDVQTREMFRQVLRFAGFWVIVASDGASALRIVELHPPDVIVLDLDLPTLPGLAVHKELQAHETSRDIPVVIVTGTEWRSPFPAAATLRKPTPGDDLVA